MKLKEIENSVDKISGISLLQFICCCIVVYIHANPISSLGLKLINMTNVWEVIMYQSIEIITKFAEISVATFYMISGYLFFKNFFSYEDWIEKINRRIKTLIIPYLFWSMIAWLFFAIVTHVPLIASQMNMKIVSLNIKEIIYNIGMSTFSPLWYLRYLFLFSVIGILLKKIINKKMIGLVVISVIVSFNLILGYKYIGFWTWIPFFMLGGYFQEHNICFKLEFLKITLILSVLFLILSYINGEDVDGIYVYFYRIVVSITAFQYFTFYVNCSNKWYYDCSMVIYCSHVILINIIEKIIFIILGKTIIVGTLAYYVVPIICIYMLIILSKITCQKLPRFWKLISGNRKLRV